MLTMRWNQLSNLWNEMDRFQSEMNQLFGRYSAGNSNWRPLAVSYPPVNVWLDEENVHVEAELPGMELDKMAIYVTQGNQLTIQGERHPAGPANGVWHRQERGFGKFSRSVTLPILVDADKVEARFEHGVLHIRLPKSEAAKPKRIAVKAE